MEVAELRSSAIDLKQSDLETLGMTGYSNISEPIWRNLSFKTRFRLGCACGETRLYFLQMYSEHLVAFQVEMQLCRVHGVKTTLPILAGCKQQKWSALSSILLNISFTSNAFPTMQREDVIIQPGNRMPKPTTTRNIPSQRVHSSLSPKQFSDNNLSVWRWISYLKFNGIFHLYANRPNISCV